MDASVDITHTRLDPTADEWRSAKGRMRLWRPSANILVIHVHGYAEKEFSVEIMKRFDAIRSTGGKVDIFFDVEEMPYYASEFRSDMTAHFFTHRAHVNSIVALAKAASVRMGISLSKLIIRNIHSCDSRAEFESTLDRALTQYGSSLLRVAAVRAKVFPEYT